MPLKDNKKLSSMLTSCSIIYAIGTHRICGYLEENCMTPRAGGRFINTTIQNIIKRPLYVGVLPAGGVKSDIFSELQIVSHHEFNRAQEIRKERSMNYAERRIPLNTKGNALLSGNVFCGQCGGRLTLTTNSKKYYRKDGIVTITPRTRYVCYNKTRYPGRCDGQTGYTTSKFDGIVEKALKSIFAKIKKKPVDEIIAAQCDKRINEITRSLEQANVELNGEIQDMNALKDELVKVVRGTSIIRPELLNERYDETKSAIVEKKAIIKALEEKLSDVNDDMPQIRKLYEDVLNWANTYAESAMPVKKMIVAQLLQEIRVSDGYKVEFDYRNVVRRLGIC